MKTWFALVALLSSLSLNPGTGLAQDGDFDVPPYEGVYQPRDRDERGMWASADESERALRDSDLVIRDEGLNNYVRSVFCKTVGELRCGNVRIYLLRVPAFNASMAPNGTMRVYSGLLLRVRSEAELASVLGHEFAHFELRHSLDGFKRARSSSDMLAWTAVLGAAAARYGSPSYGTYSNGQITILGDFYHFQRSQESDADLLGFSYLASAGFRPAAASDVWRAVMNEADSTAADRGRRSRRYDRVAFFASHPTDLARADALSALANRVPGGEYEGRNTYREAMREWIPVFLSDELALNDFGGTDYLITRLAGDEVSADLLFARGELYRQRGHPRDLENAAGFYRQALEMDAGTVEAWRGLGLSLLRNGKGPEASVALKTYLEQNPGAQDAAMLRTLIRE